MSDSVWTRPADAPFPILRRRYEGRKPLPGKDEPPRFIIQEVPDSRYDELIRHAKEFLLREEALMSAVGLRDDPQTLSEAEQLWRMFLSQQISVCALLEEEDGSAGPLVGMNILTVNRPGDMEKLQLQSEKLLRLLRAVTELESQVQPDVFCRYGVGEYLSGLGLSVRPEYRGQGLGEQLLRARWDLSRALRLHLTATVFTGTASQVLARRVGFEPLAEVQYEGHWDSDISAIKNSRSMIFMAAVIK